MSGCMNAGRPGCRGMLCRGAHSSLRRLQVFRYPADDRGRPDLKQQPDSGWLCALVSPCPVPGKGETDIPGFTGGIRPLRVIAAAGSFDTPLMAGDIVEAEGRRWRTGRVELGRLLTAELLPVEEEM